MPALWVAAGAWEGAVALHCRLCRLLLARAVGRRGPSAALAFVCDVAAMQ